MGREKDKGRRQNTKPSDSRVMQNLAIGSGVFGFGDSTMYQQLPHELTIAFKKLGKKDSLTRQKGMHDILMYLDELESNADVSALMDRWVIELSKFLTDPDHLNRVLALETTAALATHLGRDFAPYLKSIFPGWYFSQFDIVRDVRDKALVTLTEVMPKKKHNGLVIFCRKEILSFINDRLDETIQNLQIIYGMEIDVAQERYERINHSSLDCLSYLIEFFSNEDSSFLPSFLELLDNEFFKKISSKSLYIRNSMYNLIFSLLRYAPELSHELESSIHNFSIMIMGSLSETEQYCHCNMWDMVILFMNEIPDFWKNIQSPKKQVFQKLYNSAIAVFHGSGDLVYPKLLTLLTYIPDEISKKFNFYTTFLDSLWKGLMKNDQRLSEQSSLIDCYMNSMLYVLLKKTDIIDPIKFFDQNFVQIFNAYLKYKDDASPYLLTGLLKLLYNLESRESCHDILNYFWRELSTYSDEFIQYEGEIGTDMSLQCQKLAKFISASKFKENSEMMNFMNKVVNSLHHSCENYLSIQLELIVSIVYTHPSTLSNTSNVTESLLTNIENLCTSEDALRSDNQTLSNLLKLIMSIILEKEDHVSYEKTLSIIYQSRSSLVQDLMILIPRDDERWNNNIINLIAVDSLANVKKESVEDTSLISFLIERNFVSPDVFLNVQNYISDVITSISADDVSLSKIHVKNTFEIARSIIKSTYSFPKGRISSLKKLFTCRYNLSYSKLSLVLWEDVMSDILLENNCFEKYVQPLVQEMWISLITNELSESNTFDLAYELFRHWKENIISELMYYSQDNWESLLLPVQKLVSLSNIQFGIAPSVGIYQEDTDKLKRYLKVINYVSHFLLKVLEEHSVDHVFTQHEWITTVIFKAATLHSGFLNQNYDQSIKSHWKNLYPQIYDLFEDIIYATEVRPQDLLVLFKILYTTTLDNPIYINSLRIFISKCNKEWINQNIREIFSPIFDKELTYEEAIVFRNLLSEIIHHLDPDYLAELTQFLLKNINEKGRKSDVATDDFLPDLLILNIIAKRADEMIPENQVSQLVELLNSFLLIDNCTKNFVILEFAEVLFQWGDLLPTRNNPLFKNLFEKTKSYLSTDIRESVNWQNIHSAHTVLVSLDQFGKARNCLASEGDTVILDGEIVRAELPNDVKVKTVTDWDVSIGKCYRKICEDFFSIPSLVSDSKQLDSLVVSLSYAFLHSSTYNMEVADSDYLYTLYNFLNYPHVDVKNAAKTVILRTIKSRNSSSVIKREHEEEEGLVVIPEELQVIISNFDYYEMECSFENKMTLLYAWELVLEYFKTKNLKEKEDMTSYIRETLLYSVNLVSFLFYHIDQKTSPPPKSTLQISTTCAYIYKSALAAFPIFMRTWWNDITSRNLCSDVEKYTTKYVSPLLIRRELELVETFKSNPSNFIPQKEYVRTSNLSVGHGKFSVRSRKSTTSTEIVSSYDKDDFSLSITFEISNSHPFQIPSVSFSNHKGFKEKMTRKWLLSMTMLLLTKNGSVLDAVLLWKDALDKHLEGVELCPICYAVFHASDQSLPTMQCKTCNYKFHPACMYQWFKSSHKNECPMCKSLFT